MKITLFVLFLFCTAGAFGQVGGLLSSQPQIFEIPDHPMHAERGSMACEHPLVGAGADAYTYAQGELPLWEFGSPNPEPAPLGDVARAFRKEKLAAKKAEKVLEKQGT
jgi:hypothetical protein